MSFSHIFRWLAATGLSAGFSLNSTIELMKDLGRPRGDMWEVALWEDVLTVNGDEVYYTYQVDNQAIVVPENIDAVRALSGVVTMDRRQFGSQTRH